MSRIDQKLASLVSSGVKPGPALGAEEDAGFGGRLRHFRNGTIYFHPNAGAHYVSGGIKGIFDKFGGQAFNRRSRRREFGFPTSDSVHSADGSYPEQQFEFGSIHWVSGTGGVFTHGTVRDKWNSSGGVSGPMDRPISSPIAITSGEASVFANGCIFTGNVVGGKVISSIAAWPMIGKPRVVEASKPGIIKFSALRTRPVRGVTTATIANCLGQIWNDRLQLRPSGKLKAPVVSLRLNTVESPIPLPPFGKSLSSSLHCDHPLQDRTLYDLYYVRPDRKPILLSPNCVYARNAWTSFGLMHVTDLHASRRTEDFRNKLSAGSKSEFVNYNNGIRAMVKEANRLHKAGRIDAILATGDLVDYVFEHSDNQNGRGNYQFLVDLLTGKKKTESGKPGVGLQVPMFMSLGNHDYRKHPYELHFTVDIPAWFDKTLSNYSSHNLTRNDAVKLQGNKTLKVSTDRAQSMAAIDKVLKPYSRTIARQRSYTVSLGNHRIVMIDSRWDAGTLSSWRAVVNALGFGSDDERNFADGHPNSVGITKEDNNLLEQTLKEAAGTVIVGIHAPVINTAGNEYPYFFRETMRSRMDTNMLLEFHRRQHTWTGAFINQFNQVMPPKGWTHKTGNHFKDGNRKGLDYGVSRGEVGRFLELCTGTDVPRKVNLVLSGHAHQNVEYRLEKSNGSNYRYFTDFYTETPRGYYATKTGKDTIHIQVRAGADPDAKPSRVTNHRSRFSKKSWLSLTTPAYASPLSDTANPRNWWQHHSPLFIQTACLGPVDWNNRKPKEPKPSFRGYRLIEIAGNNIRSVTYERVGYTDGR